MKKINILIADDHFLFAKLISSLLKTSQDLNIIGIASDGLEAIRMVEENPVDILLLDINMPNMDGIQTMNSIIEKYPKLKIIMLSSHNEAWIIQKALKSGASGYITKSAEVQEVTEAIFTVYKGGNYCSKASLQSIVDNIASKTVKPNPEIEIFRNLSEREKEILNLISKEYTTNDIADMLTISIRTVETHRRNILQKLGVKNTVGLMKVAMHANLLEQEKSV
jgi:DNA-binding NarL/FixJ family response regulator